MTEDFVIYTEQKLNNFSLTPSLTNKSQPIFSIACFAYCNLFPLDMLDRWEQKRQWSEVSLLKVKSRSVRETQRSQEIAFLSPVANINLLWKVLKKIFDSSYVLTILFYFLYTKGSMRTDRWLKKTCLNRAEVAYSIKSNATIKEIIAELLIRIYWE